MRVSELLLSQLGALSSEYLHSFAISLRSSEDGNCVYVPQWVLNSCTGER